MTKEELKHNFINGVMDLRNKGLVEQDSLLDLFEDVIEPCIAELEKENAELKESLKKWKDAIYADVENYDKQFTKAKELLKRYVPYRQITDSKAYKDLAEETEQFLSEVEK